MDEYFKRQETILRRAINDYRAGILHLNLLVESIEDASDVIGRQSWKNAVFPIVLAIEQAG